MNDTNQNYKIVWLSANKLGYELLQESLSIGVTIDSIVTLDEDAKTVMYDGVSLDKWQEIGKKYGIRTYAVTNINNDFDKISSINPDVVIMCGWRQMLDKKILEWPKDGVVGFHPTLLPKGRGPAPIINSILDENFNSTGLTMFYAEDGVDSGDIIGQQAFTIDRKKDYAQDVYNKVIDAGRILIRNYLPAVIKKAAPRIKQDDSQATYFPKLSLKNNQIDPSKESLEHAALKVRALSKPYAGAYVIGSDGQEIKIWNVESLYQYYQEKNEETA
ncbi:MAG TPA: formyltransferase family protein [Alphaproteobacteria bacterium]|nr:formyltransferase family protein [Alphaproteobacteria bacterium]